MNLAHSRHKVTRTFTVTVNVLADGATWNAVCSLCGAQLNASITTQPVVMKLKGDISPQQFMAFKQQWDAAIDKSVGWKTPIIVGNDIELITPQGIVMQEVLVQHVNDCREKP